MSDSTNFERDRDIIEDLKTKNYEELSKKYGISVARIRKIEAMNRAAKKKGDKK